MQQDPSIDPQMIQKQKKLWKLFGRETKAGKQLFSLYNLSDKPKINYPKVKPKTQKEIQQEQQKMESTKTCPQKTIIQYPQPSIPESKFHPIDFIPKRKHENVIRKQIQQYYRKRALDIPANRGVDRSALVKKLQQKFKILSGGLPKGAQLPGLNGKVTFDQQKIKQQAKLKLQKKFSNTTQTKKQPKEKGEQLQDLFDSIVGQIDQRQKYLDSIEHLDEPKIKQRIKQQMIERIAQLQKISELKNK